MVDYGNLQPSIEVEADTFEEAQALVMPHIKQLWGQYANKPLKNSGSSVKVQAFVGGSINYDDATHTYTNDKGEVYLSGSQYAKSLEKPFELDKISDAIAKKFSANPQAIRDMWKLKGDISAGFGTAIHAALELYGKYDGLAKQIEKDAVHDHPVIKKAVQDFFKDRESEKAEYEPVIVDHEAKRAGRVDRLVVLGDKHGRIEDYKCVAAMTPEKVKNYMKQLDFYKDIMKSHGWEMEPSVIHHWDGSWKEYANHG